MTNPTKALQASLPGKHLLFPTRRREGGDHAENAKESKLNQYRESGEVDSYFAKYLYYAVFFQPGQVAQLVERGPEKAGVGGSIPSLATNPFNNLAMARNGEI